MRSKPSIGSKVTSINDDDDDDEKVKRLKVSTFIYRHLQGNPDQQRFTIIEVAY